MARGKLENQRIGLIFVGGLGWVKSFIIYPGANGKPILSAEYTQDKKQAKKYRYGEVKNLASVKEQVYFDEIK